MKNRLQIFIILVVMTLFFSELFAQKNNSSYMGNRVLLNFGTELTPAWKSPNFFENSEHWGKYYSFNYMISPSIEIIAHQKGTVGAIYHYFTTRFEYNYVGNELDWFYGNRSIGDLTTHGFGVFYKQYIGNYSRAPFGTFIKFQFDGFFYKAYCETPYPEIISGKMFCTKLTIGHDFLFFDRLKVSTAFSIGLPLSNIRGIFNTSKFFGSSYEIHDINDYIDTRIYRHYFFGCEINIGVLAF